MGALIRIALLGALTSPMPLEVRPPDRWQPIIERASIRFGIPARWIEQVMDVESHGLTDIDGRAIRSKKRAIGLMQLMPTTRASMRAHLHLGDNPDYPSDNILAGTAFLRLMYDRFGYPGLFGAYNAGPGRYARAAAGHGPLPAETRNRHAPTLLASRPGHVSRSPGPKRRRARGATRPNIVWPILYKARRHRHFGPIHRTDPVHRSGPDRVTASEP